MRIFTLTIIMLLGAVTQNGCAPQAEPTPASAENAPVEPEPIAGDVRPYPPARLRDGAENLKSRIAGRNILVVFEQNNCSACERFLPTAKLGAKNHGLELFSLIPTSDELIAFGVGNYPTSVLFINGAEKTRWLGEYNRERFLEELERQFRRQEVEVETE